MSSEQGWFENDDEYKSRVAKEANERAVENSSGSAPSKGWFESDDSYRDRIATEAAEHRIENSTGSAPSRGWFESIDTYSERIEHEANEATIKSSTGLDSPQGWFENNETYKVRIRKEANEHVITSGTGAPPAKGWFEGDHNYRSRVAHDARLVQRDRPPRALKERSDLSNQESQPYSASGSSSESIGSGSRSGGSRGVIGLLVIAGIVILKLIMQNEEFHTQTTPLPPKTPEKPIPSSEGNGEPVYGESEADRRWAIARARAANVESGYVDQIVLPNSFALKGVISKISDAEGSGAFWGFEMKMEDDTVISFGCSSYSMLYIKINGKYLNDQEAYQRLSPLKVPNVKVTLQIPNSHRNCIQSGKNNRCDNICPSIIDFHEPTEHSTQSASR